MSTLKETQAEAKMQEMFDRIAFRYDFLNSFLSMNRDKAWRKHLIRMLPQVPAGTLLDVACGTGEVVLEAIRQKVPFSRFIAVDISIEMLAVFQKKRLESHPPIEIHQMNADELLLPDQCVDCITIAFGFRNVQNSHKALLEFKRVLKPNGTLLVLDFFKPHNTLFSKFFLFYFHHILPKIGGLLSDRKAYAYLPKSVESFGTMAQLEGTLVEAGFRVGQKKSFMFGSCQIITGSVSLCKELSEKL